MENTNPSPQPESKVMKFLTKGCMIYLGIMVVIGIVVFVMSQTDEEFQEQQGRMREMERSANEEHSCSWCGKKFTGNGYTHILDECYSPKEYNANNKCSNECCYNAWNSGHH